MHLRNFPPEKDLRGYTKSYHREEQGGCEAEAEAEVNPEIPH